MVGVGLFFFEMSCGFDVCHKGRGYGADGVPQVHLEESFVDFEQFWMEDEEGDVDDPQARDHEHSDVEGRVAERRAAVL